MGAWHKKPSSALLFPRLIVDACYHIFFIQGHIRWAICNGGTCFQSNKRDLFFILKGTPGEVVMVGVRMEN